MDAASVAAPGPVAIDEPHLSAAPIATLSAVVNVPPAIEQAVQLPDMEPLHVAGTQTAPRAAWSPWHVSLAAWMIGAAIVAGVAVGRVMRFRRLLRRAQPIDESLGREIKALAAVMGISTLPRVCVVDESVSPMLWFVGVGRPRLVVPAKLLATMSAEQQAGVIAHELAHLRRRDHWVRLLELPATLLLWWHPLVWVARRGLREAEEQCCDAWAVSVLPAGRRGYADALVSALEFVSGHRRLPLGATGLGKLRTLRRRLTMIITQSPPKSLSPVGRLAVFVLLAAAMVIPVRGQAQPAAPADNPGGPSVSVAPGQSLRAAIDQAAEGATITLDEGSYPERITITKPLTLIGAGWDKTVIGPEGVSAFTPQVEETFFDRIDATGDPEEEKRIWAETAALVAPPTLTVKDAKGVTLRGLRVRGPYAGGGRIAGGHALVHFDNASAATMTGCAVVGPFTTGVSIMNGSDVRVEKSLVAAIWGTGVEVRAGQRDNVSGKPAKVHLVDSDIRNCYHRCVTVSTDGGSVIERNRVSGSAWHGIRYDNCSLTVTGNQIFGNARVGIHASGQTAAVVRGNVIFGNVMGGMTCWYDNHDTIENNTIAHNVGEDGDGVSIAGVGTPTLARNIIAGHEEFGVGAFLSSKVGEPSVGPAEPKLIDNVFWSNGREFLVRSEPAPLPEGNVAADPNFVAPDKGDFSLAPDSPARKLNAGAADPIPLASPFPIREIAIIPDGETRDYAKWKRPAATTQPAATQAQPATTSSTTKSDSGTAATEPQRDRQRAFAKSRMRQDNRRNSKDDIAEAEALYQVANKNWRSAEARASLETLIEKFPELNRTGCAVLYLGQWSSGEQREQLLTRAVEKHSDCFYGNGVQVGGFARYLLGHYYREQGKTAEAKTLFDEIRKNYPEAITHSGQSIAAILDKEGASGTQTAPATQAAE